MTTFQCCKICLIVKPLWSVLTSDEPSNIIISIITQTSCSVSMVHHATRLQIMVGWILVTIATSCFNFKMLENISCYHQLASIDHPVATSNHN